MFSQGISRGEEENVPFFRFARQLFSPLILPVVEAWGGIC